MARVEKLTGIPQEKVAAVSAAYTSEGASVDVVRDHDGTLTILATWPDDTLPESLANRTKAMQAPPTAGTVSTRNEPVSTSLDFSELHQEYQDLFAKMIILPSRMGMVEEQVGRIALNQSRYRQFVAGLGTQIPWHAVALLHSTEDPADVGRFQHHLANGDPLTDRTINFPAGRPPVGTPPFKWEDSAKDALDLMRILSESDWSTPHLLFLFERHDGFGYRRGQGMATPYLWSFSNLYAHGKYVSEKEWNPNAVYDKAGAAVLLKMMVDRGLVTSS